MDFGIAVHSAPVVPTNMRLNKRSHTLPALSSQGNTTTRQVPRRYEETRPAHVQDFSHKRILNLGLDVHHRLQQQAEAQREEAVRETETRVWKIAEEQRHKALEDLRKQLVIQAEQQLQRIKRQHEKELQERILEVETALQKEMRDAIQQERDEARERQEIAIAENDRRWEAIVVHEVATARAEEVQKATAEKAELQRQHEVEVHVLQQRAQAEKAAALEALEQRKNIEAATAVAKARLEERATAESRAAIVQERHNAELSTLRSEIAARTENIDALQLELSTVQTAKNEVEDKLLEQRARFTELVHRVFDEDSRRGQVEFLDAEDEAVLHILNMRGVEPYQLRGEAWRPHSPGPAGAGVGSVKLPTATLPTKFKIRDDFV